MSEARELEQLGKKHMQKATREHVGELVQVNKETAKSEKGVRGSAVLEVLLGVAMLVFVILPVFSAVMEKYILLEKSRIIRDAVDMTNISAYNALNTGELGKVQVNMTRSEAMRIFEEILAANLSLNYDLTPKPNSVAEEPVEVVSLEIYTVGFPTTCPDGTIISRPSVHSSISIPIQPSLYRSVILNLLGKDHIDVVVHVDSEIPLNN